MARRCSLLSGWLTAAMAVAGFSGSPGASQQAPQTTQYVYALVVLGLAVLAGVLIWWWFYYRPRSREVPQRAPKAAAVDDLTRIEGIGPKISVLLEEAGIRSFADLAAANVDRLREIVAAAGLTALADPGSWPEQARLAAEGQWERLQTLQDKLKGGRR